MNNLYVLLLLFLCFTSAVFIALYNNGKMISLFLNEQNMASILHMEHMDMCGPYCAECLSLKVVS